MSSFCLWSLVGLRISPSVPHYGGRLPSGQFLSLAVLIFIAHAFVRTLFICGPLWDIVYILGLCPKGFKPSNALFKGAIRAYGLSIAARLSLPANSGPASDDALIRTLRAAFASSGYLLPQIPGPGRSSDDDFLNPPNS